tara:strand:+ start:151 stop:546 length:396 start_codon:yes stop_codon:yes gene_type:complete
MKKINIAITGCLGRMGKQLIKSTVLDKQLKLASLTENKKIHRKINGIIPELNSENALRKANVIIDFTIPKCTLEVLKIASKLKKKSCHWNYWFYKKRGKFDKKIFKKNSDIKSWKYELGNQSFNVFNGNSI